MSLEKILSIGAAAAAINFTPTVTVDWIGVPINVLFAAILGTYAGFCFSDPVTPRAKMYSVFVACVIMGCAFTAICNGALDYYTDLEMTKGFQAGVGAVVACLTRAFIPALMDVLRTWKWVEWIPILRKTREPPQPRNPEGDL